MSQDEAPSPEAYQRPLGLRAVELLIAPEKGAPVARDHQDRFYANAKREYQAIRARWLRLKTIGGAKSE